MPFNDRVDILTQIFHTTLVAFVPTPLPTIKGSENHVTPLQDIIITFNPRLTNNIFGIFIFGLARFKAES